MEVFQREFPPNTKILKITHISNRSGVSRCLPLYIFIPPFFPSGRVMRAPADVTQFRWDYVMESGIRGTTPALALMLPGDYLPWGSGGGWEGASLWRTCSGTVLHTAFPLKVREPEALAGGAWGRPRHRHCRWSRAASARIIGIGLEILFRSGTGGIRGTLRNRRILNSPYALDTLRTRFHRHF